jgi:hypothetical protein
MVNLNSGHYHIKITNDTTHTAGSADNVHKYGCEYRFGDNTYQATSQHAMHVTVNDEFVASCLLSADGGATGIHAHTAIIHDDVCVIAVGPFVAALVIPTLKLQWVTQTDEATCFGVYHSEKHGCLISHGEMQVARITHDGKIIWQAGGADIFTNGFVLGDDSIQVVDFDNRNYELDIETGRSIL